MTCLFDDLVLKVLSIQAVGDTPNENAREVGLLDYPCGFSNEYLVFFGDFRPLGLQK